MKIRLICPTRELDENYDTHTMLGRSLAVCPGILHDEHPVERRVIGLRTKRELGAEIIGLPKLFNIAIREAEKDPAILVFIHDDIEMRDFFWPQHVVDGLKKFDMIGVAGNRRRTAKQAAWGCIGGNRRQSDITNFSGTVAHLSERGIRVSHFGPPFQQVVFIDGLFMAVKSETLLKNKIFFDERFDFHFYDMDLCRQFEVKGLKVGTWGISLMHMDNQSYDKPEWKIEYKRYLRKWKF